MLNSVILLKVHLTKIQTYHHHDLARYIFQVNKHSNSDSHMRFYHFCLCSKASDIDLYVHGTQKIFTLSDNEQMHVTSYYIGFGCKTNFYLFWRCFLYLGFVITTIAAMSVISP